MNELFKRPHAALVHIPITLYPVSFVFILMYWYLNQSEFLTAAFWCFIFAVISIIPIGLTGFLDMSRLRQLSREGERLLRLHLINGVAITLISLIAGWYFWQNPPHINLDQLAPFSIVSAGLSLMVLSQGLIAAIMIYQHHIGVEGDTR